MSTAAYPSEVAILTSVIAPDAPDLSSAHAKWLLTLKFTEEQQSQMLDLVEKGNRGTLLPEEHELLDRFRRIGMLLNLLQSKARLSLQSAGPGN